MDFIKRMAFTAIIVICVGAIASDNDKYFPLINFLGMVVFVCFTLLAKRLGVFAWRIKTARDLR